jgi:Mor family transcriptional regulator
MMKRMAGEQKRERDAVICEAFRNGKTNTLMLAREYGLERVSIQKILLEGGITRLASAAERQKRDAAICEAFRNGSTVTALAEAFNLSKTQLWTTLRANGVGPEAKQQERDNAIREMHGFGLAAKDIAFDLSLPVDTVHGILERLGLPPNLPVNHEQVERNAAICEAFRNGMSREQLMAHFKIARKTVYRTLKAEGLNISQLGSLRMKPQQMREREAAVCEAFRKGKTTFELANEFNIRTSLVQKILRNNGLRMKRQQMRERETAVCEAFRSGTSTLALANKFNIRISMVQRILRNNGMGRGWKSQ